jgi:hypothetical protein
MTNDNYKILHRKYSRALCLDEQGKRASRNGMLYMYMHSSYMYMLQTQPYRKSYAVCETQLSEEKTWCRFATLLRLDGQQFSGSDDRMKRMQ